MKYIMCLAILLTGCSPSEGDTRRTTVCEKFESYQAICTGACIDPYCYQREPSFKCEQLICSWYGYRIQVFKNGAWRLTE